MFTVRREMALRRGAVGSHHRRGNLMSSTAKRWSDIGGAPAVFAGRSLGPLFNSTPSDNLLLSSPVSESLWPDH